jgi:hypothetical protein
MPSGPRIHAITALATLPADRPTHTLRLRLKPKTTKPTGYVDGGWWPRSRDLTVELPELVRVLGVRLGGVTRVAFPLGAWRTAPRTIVVDARAIALEGFNSQDQHVLHVSGPDRQRISVLVIPPDTLTVAAHGAMMMASRRDNADRPITILAEMGVVPDESHGRLWLVRDDDEARWSTDGGRG